MNDQPAPAGGPEQTPGAPSPQPPLSGTTPGFGPPPPGYSQPEPSPFPAGAAQPGAPMPGQQPWQQGGLVPAKAAEPDWNALASSNEEREKRRRRLRIAGAVAAVVVVGGAVAGVLLVGHGGGKKPLALPSAGASAGNSSSGSPAPQDGGTQNPGPPPVGSLPAAKGSAALGLGSDAATATMSGAPGPALKLPSGPNSFARTSTPVVDTNGSFTVSAWVFSDVPTGSRSAVSQGVGSFYSFTLGRTTNPAGHNVWDFKAQVPGGGSRAAYSSGDVAVNQWTLLTGVYDASAKQLKLYVNGAAQASVDVAGVQNGPGGLQLGRLRSNAQWSDPWHGAVCGVQVWNQVLQDSDIAKLAAGASSPPSVPPAAAWLTG